MKLSEQASFLLGEYLIDSTDNLDEFFDDSIELLRGIADEKEIEFDEYYHTRWKDSADTIVCFDELYFSDKDRRDLYVYLSAQVDDEIFDLLNYVWKHKNHEILSKENLKIETDELIRKGVKF